MAHFSVATHIYGDNIYFHTKSNNALAIIIQEEALD